VVLGFVYSQLEVLLLLAAEFLLDFLLQELPRQLLVFEVVLFHLLQLLP